MSILLRDAHVTERMRTELIFLSNLGGTTAVPSLAWDSAAFLFDYFILLVSDFKALILKYAGCFKGLNEILTLIN